MKIFAKMINFVWLKCWFWCDQISKCHWLLVFFFHFLFFTLLLNIIEKQMNNSYFVVDGKFSKGWCSNEKCIGLLEIFFRNTNVYYMRRMYKKKCYIIWKRKSCWRYSSKNFVSIEKVAFVGGDEWCWGN